MDLNSVELFVAVARAGSLSEAARVRGVPLATLSRRMRGLEDEVGVRLMERSSRGLTLTDAGARLLASVEPALAVLTQAADALHGGGGISGKLRISLPPHFEPLWDLLERFRSSYPDVRLDVFVTDRRVDLVADGVDVALRVGAAGPSSYVGRTLARYRHVLVAAPAYVRGACLETPEDLTRLACACWRSSPTWTLGETTLALDPRVASNDYQHLLHLALGGHVVTEVPPFLARGPIARGQLVELLPDHPLPAQALRALVTETRLLSPLVRRFLDFLAESISSALDP